MHKTTNAVNLLKFVFAHYITRDIIRTTETYKPLAFSRPLVTSFGVYLIDFLLSIQSLYLYAGVAAGVRRDDLLLLNPLSRLLQHSHQYYHYH